MEPLSDLIVGGVAPHPNNIVEEVHFIGLYLDDNHPYRLADYTNIQISFNYGSTIRGSFCYELPIDGKSGLPVFGTIDDVKKRKFDYSFFYTGSYRHELERVSKITIDSGTLEDLGYSVLYEAVYEKYIEQTSKDEIYAIFIQDRLLHLNDSESYYKDEIKRISTNRQKLYRKLEEMSK